jgi:hypothetical protein
MVTNGIITGIGGTINKIGNGRWTISSAGALGQSLTSGTSATTTTINVAAGQLRVTNTTGSATGTATLNINGTSALEGTGAIAGVTTVANTAFLRPGLDAGTFGTLTFDSNLTLNGTFVVDGDLLGNNDQILVRNSLTLGAASIIDFGNAANYDANTSYLLATILGTRTGTFATELNLPSTHAISYSTNAIFLIPIPEPHLLGFAALGLVMTRLRRR